MASLSLLVGTTVHVLLVDFSEQDVNGIHYANQKIQSGLMMKNV